jgi:uncharacterized protein YceK
MGLLLLIATQSGCGTLWNLKAPPASDEPARLGIFDSGNCVPMGGVARSATLAAGSMTFSPSNLVDTEWRAYCGEQMPPDSLKANLFIGTLGALAIVDTPLSLVGDVVTLPLAIGREKQQPWATWWGEPKIWRMGPTGMGF